MQVFIDSCVKYSIQLWEIDDKRIGSILRFFHHTFIYSLGILYIISHTLLPSYWLLLVIYLCILSIWIQHIVCGGCIVNRIERKFLKDEKSFIDPLLDLFNIPITEHTTRGITIMCSTLIVSLVGLELSCRTVFALRPYLRFW